MAEPATPDHAVVQRLLGYLDASPSPFQAVHSTVKELVSRGFRPFEPGLPPEALEPGTKGFTARAGSIVAFRVGSKSAIEGGFRIVTAHTDSPNLRVKPQPLIRQHGYVRLGLEPYGGLIQATWTDRDLGLAGQVCVRTADGVENRLLDIRRAVCRIPNVAIHLNRKVNEEGLKLNAQTHLAALFTMVGGGSDPFRDLLASTLEVEPVDVLTWDLSAYDITPAALGGAKNEFIFSGRLDNLASCHAALEALLDPDDDAPLPDHTSVIALFDHEEIGSRTARGANSRFLNALLERIVADGPPGDGGMTRALANSWMVSTDMCHAVHPAYPEKHDPQHMPVVNRGPCIKQNANKRYATEGETAAMFLMLAEGIDVPVQWFVNRSDLACGSTVGPMVASQLSVRSLDVGNPMLSMHSAREMCGTADHARMISVLAAFMCNPL